jgi:uncharacterized beta barrel domain-containing protein DUF5777
LTPLLLALTLVGTAQETEAAPAPVATAEEAKPPIDDREIDPVEPDFVVVNLPTTARLPKGKFVFRVTHRFSDGLSTGDFGDLAANLFSLDGGAQTGLELRYGVFRSTQLWIHRTSDRTIAFHLTQGVLRQGKAPVSLQADLAIEGLDNFGEEYSPRAGVTLSRKLGERAALYVAPAFVGNTNLLTSGDDSSLVLGVGARLRVTDTMSLLAEAHPRLAGYDGDGDPLVAFGIEGRVGGHCFQFNVGNDLGTTPAQLARGHIGPNDWFLGFNVSRKFY